jgi:hypothetical protein
LRQAIRAAGVVAGLADGFTVEVDENTLRTDAL